MIRTGSVIPITPELSPAEFDEVVSLSGATIDLPGNRAGWAYVSVPGGRRYKTWVSAPEVTA